MSETTTDAAVQEPQALDAQPVEQPAEAVLPTESEPTTATEGEQQEAQAEPEQSDNSQESNDPSAYWQKKGIDISTPEGLAKATQSYQEAEKRMHQTAQRSSELEKQLSSTASEQVSNDPIAQQAFERAAAVELTMKVKDWKAENNVTPQQDQAIGEYLQANQDKAWMLKNDYLSLDDIAAMSGALKQDADAIKSQGGKDALEKLANKQIATSVPGNAVTSAVPQALTAANAESWWAGLGPEGRADPANRAKLDRVLGG